jgi:hypothetical protein
VRPVRGAQEVNIVVEVRGLSKIEAASSSISVQPTVVDEDGNIHHDKTLYAEVVNGAK